MPDESIFSNITETVGNTPLVALRRMTASRNIEATVLVKIEYLNPTGSVKDRMAIHILTQALKDGRLKEGGTIIEATSGNTGAAACMFAAAHGMKSIMTIPDKMSIEKVDTLRAFGAEVHICPTAVPPDHPESYYETAKRLAEKNPGSFVINQYHNLDNLEAHYRTTGPEIWRQTNGKIDCFVAGIGTGGTMSGTAKYLKEQNSDIECVAVDVDGSVYYDYFKTKELPEPHPYLVEGIGDDMLCENVDFTYIDEMYKVDDKTSFVVARELARTEGILAGGSSGSAVHAALEHAKKMQAGQVIVVILPDWGAKYITKMFNDDWMREKGFVD